MQSHDCFAVGSVMLLCFLQAEQNLPRPFPPEEEPVHEEAPQLLAAEATGEERGAPDPAPALTSPVSEERGAGTGPQLNPRGRTESMQPGEDVRAAWLGRGMRVKRSERDLV